MNLINRFVRKYNPFYLTVTANVLVLLLLLFLSLDILDFILTELLEVIEILKIIGAIIVSVILVKVTLPILYRKNIIPIQKSINITFICTVIACTILTINYSFRILENRIIKRGVRNSIISKIQGSNSYPFGSNASYLTYEEYSEITEMTWFPDIPNSAENISYEYYYDGFLPDYSFKLTYDVPLDFDIEAYNSNEGMNSLEIKTFAGRKHITLFNGSM